MINRNLFFIFTLFISQLVFSQLVFQISPGPKFNGINFGYRLDKKFLFYVGCQYITATYDFIENGTRLENGKLTLYREESEFTKDVYIPNLGLKYYFGERKKIRPYVNLNLAKPLVKGFPKNTNNKINWTGEFGFGVEYFFDENFGIGGEFGIRNLNVNVTNESKKEMYDPVGGNNISTTKTTELKTNFSPTYTRVSLNYYF